MIHDQQDEDLSFVRGKWAHIPPFERIEFAPIPKSRGSTGFAWRDFVEDRDKSGSLQRPERKAERLTKWVCPAGRTDELAL